MYHHLSWSKNVFLCCFHKTSRALRHKLKSISICSCKKEKSLNLKKQTTLIPLDLEFKKICNIYMYIFCFYKISWIHFHKTTWRHNVVWDPLRGSSYFSFRTDCVLGHCETSLFGVDMNLKHQIKP